MLKVLLAITAVSVMISTTTLVAAIVHYKNNVSVESRACTK